MATSSASQLKEIRLVVLGHSATHIVRGFVSGHYSDEYDPTGGSWRCQKLLQGDPVMLQIDDLSWPDHLHSYVALLKQLLQQAHILIHVLEPTRSKSNEKLERLRFGERRNLFDEEKQRHGYQEAVIVLWRDDEMVSKSQEGDQWKEGIDRGREFAEKAGALRPFVAHANTGEGIDEAFMELANTVSQLSRATEHRGEEVEEIIPRSDVKRKRKSGMKEILESISHRFRGNQG